MKVLRLDKTALRGILLRYGTDMSTWPQEFQGLIRLNMHNAEFLELIEEEKRFEEMLSSTHFEPANPGLAERIILAAHTRSQHAEQAMWQYLYHAPIIKPAAIAAMLVIGFAVGFGTFTTKSSSMQITPLQSYSDDI